ncbi:MAG TPA: Maf family protein [bacterium]|nr:Maf family protein [bacterium]
MDIVLASASPRRAQLLRQLGLRFTVYAPAGGEDPEDVAPSGPAPGEDPVAAARHAARSLAEAKAASAAAAYPRAVVIGADTIVVACGRFLAKPADAAEAAAMLRALSGRRHHVVTGVAVVRREPALQLSDTAVTAVWFRPLADDEIARYVASGEPLDKAGAYGIQGRAALFVERIEGDYFTVVGLPLAVLGKLLAQAGVVLP